MVANSPTRQQQAPRRPVLGLTGGLASGKGAATQVFQQLGVNIVDADVISRQLTVKGSPPSRTILKHYGESIADDTGEAIDRFKLRQLVFNDAAALTWLEQLLHPLINQEIKQQLSQSNSRYSILVSPLLLESRQRELCQQIIVIMLKPETQIKRACARDKISPQLAQQIMARQLDYHKRLSQANHILDNNGSQEQLAEQVRRLDSFLLRLYELAR